MGTLGLFSLILALIVCAYSLIAVAKGVRTKSLKWIKSSQNAVIAVCGLVSLAGVILIYSFVVNDFHLQYVAEHSARNLPLAYRLSAFWAGQEGSLLLWEWLLTLFAVILIIQNRRKNKELMPYVSAIMMAISLFFLILLIFVTKPFRLLSFLPSDGRGLNPLLQNPGMVLHPPAVFLGYGQAEQPQLAHGGDDLGRDGVFAGHLIFQRHQAFAHEARHTIHQLCQGFPIDRQDRYSFDIPVGQPIMSPARLPRRRSVQP